MPATDGLTGQLAALAAASHQIRLQSELGVRTLKKALDAQEAQALALLQTATPLDLDPAGRRIEVSV